MTLAVSQDRILKVLSESGLAQLLPEGEAAGGEGFLELMDELVGGGGKKDDASQEEKPSDSGKGTVVTPLAALDAALASASIAGAMQITAQISNATAVETDAAAVTAVKDLAQLLVKSANDAQGVVQTPSDPEGADMSQAGQTLQAWSQGPASGAAMTTGAQEQKPMQLSVVDVATHFAPVDTVAEITAPPEQPRMPADVPAKPASTAQVAVGAAVVEQPAGNGNFSGQSADKNSQDRQPEQHVEPEARLDVGAGIDAVAEPAQPTIHHTSPARQVANEVVRELPAVKHALELAQDAKAPLSKLQVLKIQLQPENLGSVNVRIQLRADTIELHIDTSRAETAELLKRDRETLSAIMRAAGYSADDAQIKVTHGDASMSASLVAATDASGSTNPQNSQNSQNGAQSQAQSGGNASHDRSAGSQERDGGQRRAGQEQGRHQPDDNQKRPGANTTGSLGVYL